MIYEVYGLHHLLDYHNFLIFLIFFKQRLLRSSSICMHFLHELYNGKLYFK